MLRFCGAGAFPVHLTARFPCEKEMDMDERLRYDVHRKDLKVGYKFLG